MSQPFEAKGVVKSYSAKTGYGFVVVERNGVPDVFLPRRCLDDIGRSSINEGARLRVAVEYKKNKPRVKKILAVQ